MGRPLWPTPLQGPPWCRLGWGSAGAGSDPLLVDYEDRSEGGAVVEELDVRCQVKGETRKGSWKPGEEGASRRTPVWSEVGVTGDPEDSSAGGRGSWRRFNEKAS